MDQVNNIDIESDVEISNLKFMNEISVLKELNQEKFKNMYNEINRSTDKLLHKRVMAHVNVTFDRACKYIDLLQKEYKENVAPMIMEVLSSNSDFLYIDLKSFSIRYSHVNTIYQFIHETNNGVPIVIIPIIINWYEDVGWNHICFLSYNKFLNKLEFYDPIQRDLSKKSDSTIFVELSLKTILEKFVKKYLNIYTEMEIVDSNSHGLQTIQIKESPELTNDCLTWCLFMMTLCVQYPQYSLSEINTVVKCQKMHSDDSRYFSNMIGRFKSKLFIDIVNSEKIFIHEFVMKNKDIYNCSEDETNAQKIHYNELKNKMIQLDNAFYTAINTTHEDEKKYSSIKSYYIDQLLRYKYYSFYDVDIDIDIDIEI